MWVGLGVVGVVVASVLWWKIGGGSESPPGRRAQPLSALTPDAGPAPWPLPADPALRVQAAGLPERADTPAVHFHAHLDIFVDGRRVRVPKDIGISGDASSALHTHTDSGILHVETDDKAAVFTLGQLFTEWGVQLSDVCIGQYCAPNESAEVIINGGRWTGKVADVQLSPFDEIAIVIGSPPRSIPRSFGWQSPATRAEMGVCEGGSSLVGQSGLS